MCSLSGQLQLLLLLYQQLYLCPYSYLYLPLPLPYLYLYLPLPLLYSDITVTENKNTYMLMLMLKLILLLMMMMVEVEDVDVDYLTSGTYHLTLTLTFFMLLSCHMDADQLIAAILEGDNLAINAVVSSFIPLGALYSLLTSSLISPSPLLLSFLSSLFFHLSCLYTPPRSITPSIFISTSFHSRIHS